MGIYRYGVAARSEFKEVLLTLIHLAILIEYTAAMTERVEDKLLNCKPELV